MSIESSGITFGPAPSPALLKWPWLDRMIDASWFLMVLALYLGILALAAVAEIAVECRDATGYVRTTDGGYVRTVDGGRLRTVGQSRRECRLVWRGS
jgi:hypothetical protein